METSDTTTPLRRGCKPQTPLSYWTSRFRGALFEQFAAHASVLISGFGSLHTGIKAFQFLGRQFPNMHKKQLSTCSATLAPWIDSSRTSQFLPSRVKIVSNHSPDQLN